MSSMINRAKLIDLCKAKSPLPLTLDRCNFDSFVKNDDDDLILYWMLDETKPFARLLVRLTLNYVSIQFLDTQAFKRNSKLCECLIKFANYIESKLPN